MANPQTQTAGRTSHEPFARSRPGRPAQTSSRLQGAQQVAPLRNCLDTISETFAYCIQKGGRYVEANHLTTMLDAWDIVACTCNLTSRTSAYGSQIEAICANAVKACEESCEEFSSDTTVTACADACREAYRSLTGSATKVGAEAEEE